MTGNETLTATRAGRYSTSRSAGFRTSGLALAVVMAGSSVVSPLYDVYQATWHFSTITLTAIFAVYAASLLAVLLVAGNLSDRVGRRPMMAVAALAEAAAAGVFLAAHGVAALYVGRLLQGVATGAGVGAAGAALLELQPPGRPTLGGTVNASGSMGALAVGAVGASALVQYGPAPTRLVFWLLLAVSLLTLGLIAVMPEPVTSGPVEWADLRPRAGVPRAALPDFLVALPALVATWALGGLYFSLGPSIAAELSHSRDALWGGLVIALLTGAGAVAAFGLRSLAPGAAMLRGSAVLAVGSVVTLVGIVTGASWGLLVGSAIAGLGFGTAYLGAFRHLSALAAPAQRGALVASIYVVSYLSFSVPVLVAGTATTAVGLHPVAVVYAAGVISLSALATVLQVTARRRPRRAAAAPAAEAAGL